MIKLDEKLDFVIKNILFHSCWIIENTFLALCAMDWITAVLDNIIYSFSTDFSDSTDILTYIDWELDNLCCDLLQSIITKSRSILGHLYSNLCP